jgi:hypothetical protein
MKRSMVMAALAGLTMICASGPGRAADLDSGGRGASSAGTMCIIMPRSPLLELSSDRLQSEVERRYQHAVDVAADESTISSRSARWVWSNEAKVACGKAIGYFAGREINEETISKCDCFHGRMLAFMR